MSYPQTYGPTYRGGPPPITGPPRLRDQSSGVLAGASGTITLPSPTEPGDTIVICFAVSGAIPYVVTGGGAEWTPRGNSITGPITNIVVGRAPVPGTTSVFWSGPAGTSNGSYSVSIWSDVDAIGQSGGRDGATSPEADCDQRDVVIASASYYQPPSWQVTWSNGQPGTRLAGLTGAGTLRAVCAEYITALNEETATVSATFSPATGTAIVVLRAAPLEPEEPEPPPPPPPPPPLERPALVPVIWDGLELNAGDRPDGLCVIVTECQGWYGTPGLDGHDLARALTDGSVWGTKIKAARVVTITGTATGPRELCLEFSRDLAAKAGEKLPSPLAIGEDGQRLTADVRGDDDGMSHEWRGPVRFTYQLVLHAADPRLYEEGWQQAVLTLGEAAGSGRTYPRAYPWRYGQTSLPNAALLTNRGSADAPVFITYHGALSATRITDGVRSIRMTALESGWQAGVDSETLTAVAPGGAPRAAWLLPGSEPLMVPARSAVTWRLYGTGPGMLQLRWRGAYA